MTILLTTEKQFAAMDFTSLASCVSMAGGVILSCERIDKGYKVEVEGVKLSEVKDCAKHIDISEFSDTV